LRYANISLLSINIRPHGESTSSQTKVAKDVAKYLSIIERVVELYLSRNH